MARKGADRLTREQRAKLDRLARRRPGAGRSTGTWVRQLALDTAERETRARELLRRLERSPAAHEHAGEVERRRRED